MYLFTIIFRLLCVLSIIVIVVSDSNETDHAALLAIKSKITHDPHGFLRSWNDSVNFCLWEGVTCDRQRVTALELSATELVGTLSPFVGNLSFLRELIVINNSISGPIPPEVGRLSRLQELLLLNNAFEGEIPANISGCLRLKNFRLTRNNLVGKIPFELSLLSELEQLALDSNNLTGDNLSPLANLTSLQELYLSNQIYQGGPGFMGEIPDFIGEFVNLTVLAIGGNNFTGTIPPSLYNLSKIETFSASTNQLEGTLPPDIGFAFPKLQMLQIGNNQLSGPVPLSLSNLSKLELLDLSSNNFSGKFLFDGSNMQNFSYLFLYDANLGSGEADDLKFIDTLVNCSHLDSLSISGNNFGGILPRSIANLSTTVRYLDFGNNQISGTIPFGLGKYLNLQYIVLDFNQFTGNVPADLGRIPMLQEAYLSNNMLSGSIPLSLGNLSWLSILTLQYNNLQGTVPNTLGNCKSLLYLYLSQNNLVGNIPQQLFQATTLVELLVDHNHLQGSIPSEIGDLKNLVIVEMSSNNLSGTIPSSLGQCNALTYLSLAGNSFIGFIPPSFSLLNGLYHLDLSSNKLSGQVPEYFSNFSSLTLLNLSYNNLEGEIPTKGVFANLSALSVVGNAKLCGGIPQLELPSCPKVNSKRKKNFRALVIAVSISSVLVGLIIFSSVYLLCSKRRREASSRESLFKEPFLKVSYDMLLKATNGFSQGALIGSGGFGSVYKGTLLLGQVKKVVAVKVINNQCQGARKSFMAECEALRIIRHSNLVGVITACSSIDFQGNAFRALVYELMSNGSLERWLYSNPEDNDQFLNLSLLQRLHIAIDVAHALDYLHNGNDIPIIHCDLKPTNILLDEDMTAHVGDFGLVKLLPEISEQPRSSSSIGVRGTVGYAAPEYGLGASVSAAGDVYSYGIILLELLTAKKPTDSMFEGSMSLHKFAESALADNVLEIVDPKLKVDDDEKININLNDSREDTKCAFECISSMIIIGVKCSSELPQDRMNIKDVIRQLQYHKDHLLLRESKAA